VGFIFNLEIRGSGGGGGPVVHTHQTFGGFVAGVSSGDLLAFGGTVIGDTLFDLTTPTHAFVLEDGLYSIIAQVGPDAGAVPGKTQKIQLSANFATDPIGSVSVYETTPLDFAGVGGPVGWVSITWYMEVGDEFNCTIYHDIGAPTDYDFNFFVQRLS
jgi:hypothetical protein